MLQACHMEAHLGRCCLFFYISHTVSVYRNPTISFKQIILFYFKALTFLFSLLSALLLARFAAVGRSRISCNLRAPVHPCKSVLLCHNVLIMWSSFNRDNGTIAITFSSYSGRNVLILIPPSWCNHGSSSSLLLLCAPLISPCRRHAILHHPGQLVNVIWVSLCSPRQAIWRDQCDIFAVNIASSGSRYAITIIQSLSRHLTLSLSRRRH